MKKFYALATAVLLTITLQAQVTYTWNGLGTGNNYTTAANWTPVATPQTTDVVIFNGATTKSCVITTTTGIAGFTITSAHTGSILMSTGRYEVYGDYAQDGGIMTASSGTNATTGGMLVTGSFIHSGGTFNHNNGLLRLSLSAGVATATITGATSFNRLRVFNDGVIGTHQVNFGTGITTRTLTFAFGGDIVNITGSVTATGRFDISGSSGIGTLANNTGTIVLGGTGNIVVNGTSNTDPNECILPNIELNTTGNVTLNDFISFEGNWVHNDGNIQPNGSVVNVMGAASNISGTSIDGVQTNFDNLQLDAAANLTIPTGTAHVIIADAFLLNGGTANLSSAGLGFSGGAASIDIGGLDLNFLRVMNGGDLTLATGVNILDSLSLEGSGVINTSNSLTLATSPSLKARIGELTGGAINGDITVNSYLPGGTTGWGLLGSPGVQSQNVGMWENTGTPMPTNLNLFMTCNDCLYAPSTVGNFTSVQIWDENTLAGFDGSTVKGTNLTEGRGMWFYIGNNTSTSTDIFLTNTGPAVVNDINVVIPANVNGFVLLANPYACPISADLFLAANSGSLNQPTIWAFDADNFVYTSYTSPNTSMPGNATDITNVIAAGQGFFVDAQSAVTFTFSENMKLHSNQGPSVVRKAGSSIASSFKLELKGAYGDMDKTMFRFDANAQMQRDWYDAPKMFSSPGYYSNPQPYNKYTTISTRMFGNDFMINGMPVLSQSVTVPVLVRTGYTGSFTISLTDVNNFSSCAILRDKLDGSLHDLSLGQYVFTLSDTTSAPRFEMIICSDPGSNPVGVKQLVTPEKFIQIGQDVNGVFVKSQFPEKTKSTISAYNIIGQKLMDDIIVEGMEINTHLNLNVHEQVVIVKVTSGQEVSTKKLIVH